MTSDVLFYHTSYSTSTYFSKLIDITAYVINILNASVVAFNVLLRQFFFFKLRLKVSIFSLNRKIFKSCENIYLNAN